MPDVLFTPVSGMVQNIEPMLQQCCQQLLTLRTSSGIINFTVSPSTSIYNNTSLQPGMNVTAFYDATLPVPLIYPPQYQAVFISPQGSENIIMDYFDASLTASNYPLKLNPDSQTEVVTLNGQPFFCYPGNRILIVYYGATTRSIPAQTRPRKIIVMC